MSLIGIGVIWVLMIWQPSAGYIPQAAWTDRAACYAHVEPSHRTPDLCVALTLHDEGAP